MANRWCYTHAGSAYGPISYAQLKQLAASAEVLPTDLVWPEGGDPRRAVEVERVLNFKALGRGSESTGKWMGKIAQTLAATPQEPGATPAWLADVREQEAPVDRLTDDEIATFLLAEDEEPPAAPAPPAATPLARPVAGPTPRTPTPSKPPSTGASVPQSAAEIAAAEVNVELVPLSSVVQKPAAAPVAQPVSRSATPIAQPVSPAAAPVAQPVSRSAAPVAQPVAPIAQPVSRSTANAPRLVVSSASSRGRVRDQNEDRYHVLQWSWNDGDGPMDVALLVIADGMGGYQGGEEASTLTVRTVASRISAVVEAAMGGRTTEGATVASALQQAIRESSRLVFNKGIAEPRYKGMGATAAVVIVWNGRAYFAHVGDCRIYLHRDNELKQLTEDQTLVARMVAMGQLTAEEAEQHESRNEVSQAIGKRQSVDPSKGELILASGDYLLVACDGLAAHVDKATIGQTLSRPPVTVPHLAGQFVTMADEGGGSDNCTVIVAHFA
jgi:protein phosphatase